MCPTSTTDSGPISCFIPALPRSAATIRPVRPSQLQSDRLSLIVGRSNASIPGNMNKSERMLCIAAFALSLSIMGCGRGSLKQVRARAAFDLNCESKSLSIHKIDGNTVGVRGCGQQATYVKSCYSNAARLPSCSWVMNNQRQSYWGEPNRSAPVQQDFDEE